MQTKSTTVIASHGAKIYSPKLTMSCFSIALTNLVPKLDYLSEGFNDFLKVVIVKDELKHVVS